MSQLYSGKLTAHFDNHISSGTAIWLAGFAGVGDNMKPVFKDDTEVCDMYQNNHTHKRRNWTEFLLSTTSSTYSNIYDLGYLGL
ncbi:hypothetical protein P8452_74579 [Trifolium repens]|nr:hypothetical protein P8452_74579 [Trifolium repens]